MTSFERWTERARQVVVLAQDEAMTMRHNYLASEHLLLGLLREGEGCAYAALTALGITLGETRADVVRIVGFGDAPVQGQLPHTPRMTRVCELALREALSLGHNYIGTEHILLGIAREGQSVAYGILLGHDVGIDQIRDQVIKLMTAPRRAAPIVERTLEEKVNLLIIKVAALETAAARDKD